MPNFTPSGKIRIGRVPFDNSYRHTLTFANAAAQEAYFTSVCTQALEKDTYTYVRMNNSIRVQFNAEQLYTYDYVMYQNSNYGTKWFYAFIVGVNYINENTTELVLELDVMQTWYFDYQLEMCFVEREHVNDDTVGLHINPEPNMDLEYIYDSFYARTYEDGNYWIVMLVTSEPHAIATGGGNISYSGADPVSGGLYQNLYSACKVHVYKGWTSSGLTQFKNDVNAYNESGAAESIVDVYCAPITSIKEEDLTPSQWPEQSASSFTMDDGAQPFTYDINVERPTTLNGFEPNNNKLLCFPYCYLELGDFTGRTEQLRWEFFELTETGRAVLQESMCGVSDCQGYITPQNYNGITDQKMYKPFTFDFTNKISWIYSTYQNWMAQNSVVNQLAILGSVGAMAGGVGAGISAASAVLGAGAASAGNLGNLSGINTLAGQRLLGRNAEYYSKAAGQAYLNEMNGSMIAGGAGGLLGTMANIERMRRIPNTAKGNTSGNSKFQNGYSGWYYAKVCIREEFAKIADDFFDMYGYQIDRVKVPNREGRKYWNYVKCQNSCHHAKSNSGVPASDMDKINRIYDAGITFWHPWNGVYHVGNYSMHNIILNQ